MKNTHFTPYMQDNSQITHTKFQNDDTPNRSYLKKYRKWGQKFFLGIPRLSLWGKEYKCFKLINKANVSKETNTFVYKNF